MERIVRVLDGIESAIHPADMTLHRRLSPVLTTALVLASVAATVHAPSLVTGAHASSPAATSTAAATAASDRRTDRAFAELERSHQATLGVVAIDTGSGRTVSYHADDRFPFASTNKTFIAAAVLQRSSDADLDRIIRYSEADLLDYAPITSRFVDSGMTVRELIDAMLRFSDNTAANLLVADLGGTQVVQSWLRGIGDDTTRVDRTEPSLNEALPGDARDTTTPAQFAADLQEVVLGDVLDVKDRTLLRNTMLDCTTGDATIRAGVDPAWPVADKTGTGSYGVRADIAVVYPTGRDPLIVVTMSRKAVADATADSALLAEAAEEAVDALR